MRSGSSVSRSSSPFECYFYNTNARKITLVTQSVKRFRKGSEWVQKRFREGSRFNRCQEFRIGSKGSDLNLEPLNLEPYLNPLGTFSEPFLNPFISSTAPHSRRLCVQRCRRQMARRGMR